MKNYQFIFALPFLLFLDTIFRSVTILPTVKNVFHFKAYQLGPESVLEINGKTNISSFCCSSKQHFPKGEISYRIDDKNATFFFRNTLLKIDVTQLDCGSKPMNKDLQKTLRADEYPHITIALKEAQNLECDNILACEQWTAFETVANITLAQTTKTVSIPVQIMKTDHHRFRASGSTRLSFNDFNLEPPTALMGLIKVKESIDIRFDFDVILL